MPRGTDITQFKRVYRQRNEGDFPQELQVALHKEHDLKYGKNPHQQVALYTVEQIGGHPSGELAALTQVRSVRSDGKGKGGLSLTNLMDITGGWTCSNSLMSLQW